MMIKEIRDKTTLPWDLLLNADPDLARVASYITDARIFVYQSDQSAIIGILVLSALPEAGEFEIMIVSVSPKHFRQGIGKSLLNHVIANLRVADKTANIWIKTGDLTEDAIALYQSVGFEIVETVKDYFIDNYAEPIYEHGERLRHQVVMKLR